MRAYKLLTMIVLSGLLVLFGAPLGAEDSPANPPAKFYYDITPAQLKAKLDNQEHFLLIDSRSPFRYTAGHIHGARSIPWKEMSPQDLPADKGAMVVFYCDGPG